MTILESNPRHDRLDAFDDRAQSLSSREREVLARIGRGCSNQEIADDLFLSLNTVKTYIRTAYRKIGVERRTQAVIWWINSTAA